MGAEPSGAVATLVHVFSAHLEHALAATCSWRASRTSSRRASRRPTLVLEANPIVRKLGWPFAWASVLLCLVAYIPDYGMALAVPGIVISLLVAGGNFSRGWAARSLGESEYPLHLLRVFASAKPTYVYLSIAAGNVLVGAVGGLMLVFYPEPTLRHRSMAPLDTRRAPTVP